MRARMERRDRAVALATDMTAHSVGARELQNAMTRSVLLALPKQAVHRVPQAAESRRSGEV